MKKNIRDHPKEDDRSVDFQFIGSDYSVPLMDNLQIRNLSVIEIKEALNKVSGEVTYWESLLTDVDTELNNLNDKYESLYAKWYMEASEEAPPKSTEGYKKSLILVNNTTKHKAYLRNKRALEKVRGKIKSLVKGYETQSRTLQSIAGITKTQLSRLGLDPTPDGLDTGKKKLEAL